MGIMSKEKKSSFVIENRLDKASLSEIQFRYAYMDIKCSMHVSTNASNVTRQS